MSLCNHHQGVMISIHLDWKSKRTRRFLKIPSVKERVEQMGRLQIASVQVKIYMAMVIDNQFVIFL